MRSPVWTIAIAVALAAPRPDGAFFSGGAWTPPPPPGSATERLHLIAGTWVLKAGSWHNFSSLNGMDFFFRRPDADPFFRSWVDNRDPDPYSYPYPYSDDDNH